MALYDKFSGEQLKIAEKIQQRRLQMLVHSYIYYELDDNLVPDNQWAKWANELKDLQEQYPDIEKAVPYRKGFENWDASTGAFLPYDSPRIISTAQKLLDTISAKSSINLPDKPKVTTKNTIRKKLF